jgi:hypothetical protein
MGLSCSMMVKDAKFTVNVSLSEKNHSNAGVLEGLIVHSKVMLTISLKGNVVINLNMKLRSNTTILLL